MRILRRILRHPALWIIAAVVAVWGTTGASLLYQRWHTPTTGDALLDRYLEYADASTGTIPAGILKQWEPEFGKDPRFWELCYSCDSDYHPDVRTGYLLEAQKRGVASAPLLECWRNVKEEEWQEEAGVSKYDSYSMNQDKSLTSEQKQDRAIADLQLGAKRIDEKYRAERDKVYAELLAAGDDLNWPHYRMALLDFQRGEYKAALGQIDRGNVAKNNLGQAPFPFSEYRRQLKRGGPLASHVRAYVIATLDMAATLPNFVRIKQMHHKLWRQAIATRDTKAMNTLHQYACHFGTMEDGETISTIVSLVLLGYEDNSLLNHNSRLTAIELKHLNELELKRGQLKTKVVAVAKNTPAMNSIASSNTISSWVHRLVSGNGLATIELAKATHADNRLIHRDLAAKCWPLFNEIARFDFATMNWTPKAGP